MDQKIDPSSDKSPKKSSQNPQVPFRIKQKPKSSEHGPTLTEKYSDLQPNNHHTVS